ncbi:hypothetical protein COV18_05495, partial [Candidatus Woesearchaeota archaeon CG10_big_fil_rev_8_21_14_0_10_37_12]
MNNLLVTAYESPDLDGAACAFAYAELLNKQGKSAVAGVFGNPHREAQFVMETFNISNLTKGDSIISDNTPVILVDASDLRGISKKINPEQVIEIIDHRKIHEGDKFPNAKIQIELVGSAATLIAEKFNKANVEPSEDSAALLYSAIISNTINFQANVTTIRDKEMAEWLITKINLPNNYIHEMFVDKSKFRKSLKETIDDDFATFNFNNTELGIGQLEIIDVDEFVEKEKTQIKKNVLFPDLKVGVF